MELRVYAGVDPETHRRRYRTATVHGNRADAQRALDELVAAVRADRSIGSRSPTSELLEAWFAIASASWAPTTIRQTRSVLDRYLHPHLGHLRVGDVTPAVIEARNVPLLFLVVGVAFWQYGGGLSLLPALTADFYGAKNLGTNYGFVFLGWGLAFFGPQLAAELRTATGRADLPFYLSAAVLAAAVVVGRFVRRPT